MSALPSLLLATAAPLTLTSLAASTSNSGRSLGIEVPHQEQDWWCWCAVTVGVSTFYDSSFGLSQCETAAQILSEPSACSTPRDDRVNRMFSLKQSLNTFGRLDRETEGPLSFSQVVQEIDAQRPVGARILFLDSGVAHFTIIRGYRKTPQQMLLIDDPLYDESETTYQSFLTAYRGSGRWKQSYLTT